MLYIADWKQNGKIRVFANDDLATVIAHVYKERVAKGKTRYQEIDTLRKKRVAVVFKGTMGSKKGMIISGVWFPQKDTVYSLNENGIMGHILRIPYRIHSQSYSYIDECGTLAEAKRRACEYLSRSKNRSCHIGHVMNDNFVGTVTKDGDGFRYHNHLTDTITRINVIAIKKVKK